MQCKVGRLREKQTDDPGTVSKTFRDSFFGKGKNEEEEGIEKGERASAVETFEKVSGSERGERWTKANWSIFAVEKLRTEMNRVNEPGLFTALLSRLTDFETFQKHISERPEERAR